LKFFEKSDFCDFVRFDIVLLLVYQDQHCGNQRAINHHHNCIQIITNKVGEIHFLLKKAEKHLNIPSFAVNISNCLSVLREYICQEKEFFSSFLVLTSIRRNSSLTNLLPSP